MKIEYRSITTKSWRRENKPIIQHLSEIKNKPAKISDLEQKSIDYANSWRIR